jgi:protein import protein ZIM17
MVTDTDLKRQIFGDKSMTIEDIIREQGQLVKKGTLSEDGDFEIWADGTVTDRPKPTGEGEGVKVQEVAAPSEKL